MRGRPFLIISVLALFAISCGEIEKALQETEKTWRGTWRVATVTLDGENQPAYSAVWTLNDNEWRLVTAVCEASGPLSSNGNDLSLTVGATTCQRRRRANASQWRPSRAATGRRPYHRRAIHESHRHRIQRARQAVPLQNQHLL
ncbi:MAG: hypothetical protein HY804_08970 [Nitrospinae bacterium]|nr:hypothetical protein [Nitrospinota bacterium]